MSRHRLSTPSVDVRLIIECAVLSALIFVIVTLLINLGQVTSAETTVDPVTTSPSITPAPTMSPDLEFGDGVQP